MDPNSKGLSSEINSLLLLFKYHYIMDIENNIDKYTPTVEERVVYKGIEILTSLFMPEYSGKLFSLLKC